MLVPAALVALGIAGLYVGAEWLVRASVSFAFRFGLTPLVIGLTVVAFGTSMPELVVAVGASLEGRQGIAVGSVVGSNIANIALILGILALIQPPGVRAQSVRVDVPLMIAVSVLLVFFLGDGRLSRPEGVVLLAGLIAFTILSLHTARKEPEEIQAEYAEGVPAAVRPLRADLTLIVAGCAFLAAGARALVHGASDIAEIMGVTEAVIGLTVVAVGTSLPELATSVVAALKRESDIAVGNLVGSNIFNVLGIVGAASVVRPLGTGGVTGVDLAVMVGLAIVLLPLMWTGFRVNRWEGGALLASYVLYVGYLLFGMAA